MICDKCFHSVVCKNEDYDLKECGEFISRGVVKIKHGNWCGRKDCFNNIYYLCSLCGGDSSFKANFCPNCGADMRGEING